MNKVYADAEAALHDVKDGITLMSGGFGLCGNAENSIRELARRGVKDLTVVSNNCGKDWPVAIAFVARSWKSRRLNGE